MSRHPPLMIGGGLTDATLGKLIPTGLALSGLTGDYAYFWDDFLQANSGSAPLGYQNSNVSSGSAATAVAGAGGGIVNITSGATGGGAAIWYSQTGAISNISTKPWYHAKRSRTVTAVDALAVIGTGLINQGLNKTIIAGLCTPLDASNYGVQYDGNAAGSFLSFGVAKDTGVFHFFEAWGRGDGKIYARMDGGTIVSATMAAAPSDYCDTLLTARNGGTAAARSEDVDYVLTLCQRI